MPSLLSQPLTTRSVSSPSSHSSLTQEYLTQQVQPVARHLAVTLVNSSVSLAHFTSLD